MVFDVDWEEIDTLLLVGMTDTVLSPVGRGQLRQPRLPVTVTVAVSMTTLVTRYLSSKIGLAEAKATSADAMT